MPNKGLQKLRESIDLTLNQPGAYFQLEILATGISSSSHGIADFQNVSSTSKDSFRFPTSEPEEGQVDNNEIISLFHQGEIFHLLEVDGGEKEWTAFETGDTGWGSSTLAPLFWLQGVDQVKPLGTSRYQLSINMQRYISEQPTSDARAQAKKSLENNMVGLSTQILSCEVKCDPRGRIEWLSVIMPIDNSPEIPVSLEGEEEVQPTKKTISLSFIDHPPSIPKPDANFRYSTMEFINSAVEQDKLDLPTREKD
ncbi:hypothetical protein [Oceanobacillus jordanicus]|uniref:Phage tail protein n=1 Tax=Oceanobacillus jordanicus TaxID=2867266 RepID=A0AAW5B9L1_9BACI|nr:hypothetical protein [Oceanobacillus jordanicus]MCG3421051.1 hypothetical protein [Oceanobacillus jordanicus]